MNHYLWFALLAPDDKEWSPLGSFSFDQAVSMVQNSDTNYTIGVFNGIAEDQSHKVSEWTYEFRVLPEEFESFRAALNRDNQYLEWNPDRGDKIG